LSQSLFWLACCAGVVGLLASRALVALAPVTGVVAVLANPNLRRDWRLYFSNGAALRAAAMYLLVPLSFFYTSEWDVWRHDMFRWLPWLAVPLMFTAAVPLTSRQRLVVGSLFVLGTALLGVATAVRYLQNPAAANEAIRIGQNMPSVTRIFHIHFGLMLGLAFFFGLQLRRSRQAPAWLRGALLVAALAAAATIHLLAYRTGLLVLYTGLLALAVQLLRRRVVLGAVLLLALLGGPWLAYRTLAPVKQRVHATLWDVAQFTQGHDINNYSLSRRLAAWQTAAVIIWEHPVIGVGPADAQAAMLQQFAWRDYGLRPINRVMVHNQYLQYLLSSGVVGLALWLALLFWPLTQPTQRRNPYIWQFVLVMGTGMLVDSLLEMQIGYNLFVFGYGFLVVAGERHSLQATRRATSPSLK
jgi:O-antigen ligase